MKKQKISVAVIAQDEADRIGGLLKSLGFADEIVVVDSGSRDGTQAICQNAGAKVIFNKWPGYVAQKQFALEATAHEWILCLDADEEVPEALGRKYSGRWMPRDRMSAVFPWRLVSGPQSAVGAQGQRNLARRESS